MTEKELYGYAFIKADIERTKGDIAALELEIEEMERDIGVGAVNMDGMPHGTTPGDPVARMAIAIAALHEALKKLKADLTERLAELKRKEREIREYINGVEDEEIKLILRWRFIDLLCWYEIAVNLERITGKNVDRSTPGKKMRKFLTENTGLCANSHISHD